MMTRAEAKAEVQRIWPLTEIDGLIAVGDVELIRVAAQIEAHQSVSQDLRHHVAQRRHIAQDPPRAT